MPEALKRLLARAESKAVAVVLGSLAVLKPMAVWAFLEALAATAGPAFGFFTIGVALGSWVDAIPAGPFIAGAVVTGGLVAIHRASKWWSAFKNSYQEKRDS